MSVAKHILTGLAGLATSFVVLAVIEGGVLVSMVSESDQIEYREGR